MFGPYATTKGNFDDVCYMGNKVFGKRDNILRSSYDIQESSFRVNDLKNNAMWPQISRINNKIFQSSVEYFHSLDAFFVPLPLVTRMISSPGAVYGKEAINYTTDTCPITLDWFDLPQKAFLSESSQIYLEISLIQQNIDHVFSIYNSFRKEQTDATHLSEFHHVEYEGKVTQEKNEEIALGLVNKIIRDLIAFESASLQHFLPDQKIKELVDLVENPSKHIHRVTFAEALDALYRDTKNEKYKKFTLNGNFGSWEEIRLTEIYDGMMIVKRFPLFEVPFYHAIVEDSSPEVAENSDFIWPGYREFIGSGLRVRSQKELENKALIFNLPRKDYLPYLQTRQFPDYQSSAGFGLGWERLMQGLLQMPFIWSASHFPRSDKTLAL